MIILGINAYHEDVSAVLLRDGALVVAVEEERFRRVKHWAGFPREAIRSCLEMAAVVPASGAEINVGAYRLSASLTALSTSAMRAGGIVPARF
jgi:carbamoyltransferase